MDVHEATAEEIAVMTQVYGDCDCDSCDGEHDEDGCNCGCN
jgi:hypothetical protein